MFRGAGATDYRVRVAVNGAAAATALFLIYFVVVSLTQGYAHAVDEFLSFAYLMVPLAAGFGLQVSLFTYARHYTTVAAGHASASVGASGGVSAASMVACCAHHLTDVLPLVGVSAAALFLTAYQTLFIAVGLLSNLVGITVMLAIIQKHQLYEPEGRMAKIMKVDMRNVRNIAIVTAIVVALGLFIFFGVESPGTTGGSGSKTLQSRLDDQNGLTVEVTPLSFALGREIVFDIAFNTHEGNLDFDLTKVAYLEDSYGKTYTPTRWNGPPPGGHHMEGTLYFPSLQGKPTSMKLVLKGLYGVDSRIFEWNRPT